MFNWKDCYMSYVNLAERQDRLIRMEMELSRVGLSATRFEAFKTNEHAWDWRHTEKMMRTTPGAIGCMYSQMKIMELAYEQKKSAIVLEDDLVFATDIEQRLDYIEGFLNRQEDWDIFWLGATFHKEPVWHAKGHPQMPYCNCELHRDWQPTEDEKILRTYGIWSTYGYVVNFYKIQKILDLLKKNMHKTIGIDWEFIFLEPELKTFCFIPGSIKQYDNLSNIGKGVTMFSGFSKLGDYWFQDRIGDFNYQNFYK